MPEVDAFGQFTVTRILWLPEIVYFVSNSNVNFFLLTFSFYFQILGRVEGPGKNTLAAS
jgi:hypothetical protein